MMKQFKDSIKTWAISIYNAISGNGSPRSVKPPELSRERLGNILTPKKENSENMLEPKKEEKKEEVKKSPFILLPDNLPGIYKYFGNDPKDRDKWARPETIDCLIKLGKMATDAGFEIGAGDLSLELPGPFTNYYDKNKLDHRGHRNGNSIDIRPIRTDRKRLPVTWKHKLYDREATDLLTRMAKECGFKLVLFCDPEIYTKYNYVKYYKGHSNHLHLRMV